jgi:hypothetical protein
LSFSLSLSLRLILYNKHRRAQEQFILFISSSFLRRHEDDNFFIRRSPPFYMVDENERIHLNAMLFEKLSFPPIIRYRAQALKAR